MADLRSLRVEMSGLVGFEWWPKQSRMEAHFLSGKGGGHAHHGSVAHQVAITAELASVDLGGSMAPTAVFTAPGSEVPLAVWVLKARFDLSIAGARPGSLEVASDPIDLDGACASHPDDADAWKSIRWLPDFKALFDTEARQIAARGAHIGARLLMSDGAVRCLMPVDRCGRFQRIRFQDAATDQFIAGFDRPVTERVAYGFAAQTDTFTLELRKHGSSPTSERLHAIALTAVARPSVSLTITSLPKEGGLSGRHFAAYRLLAPDATRDVKAVAGDLCPGAPADCSKAGGAGKVTPKIIPEDPDHCFDTLIEHLD